MREELVVFNSASMSYSAKNSVSRDIVLSDVNLSVEQGEMVYLVGKIGSGKSTLLKAIYGEVPISSGACSVVGYDMTTIKKKHIPHLRRKLGIVFQDFQLLKDRSVYENLKFVLKATGWKNKIEIDHRIETILSITDLAHKAYKMPHHLSGGEQQRLVIGRALLNNPSLIIADEPTGNLDPHATESVMNMFMEIKSMGCALIIATHDISIIEKYPSRTIKFDRGVATEIDIYKILGLDKE